MTKAVFILLDLFLNPGETISALNTKLKEVYIANNWATASALYEQPARSSWNSNTQMQLW